MRRFGILAALIAATFALAGCASTGGGAPDYDGPQSGADGGGEPGVIGEDAAGDESGRDVIITGTVSLTADDPLAAAQQATVIVEAAGGRVDSRSESAPTEFGPGSAVLQLRIPAAELDAVIDEFREIGRVDRVSTDASDVTVLTRDLDARIGALETSIARIQALMADATDIGDLILIESELSQRQAELESLRAEKRALDDQVAMSTIWLEIYAPSEAIDPAPDNFSEGVAAGWHAFVAFWGGVLVALGVLAPWLVFAAIIALAVLLIVRARRRRKARAVSAALAPAEAPTPAVSDSGGEAG